MSNEEQIAHWNGKAGKDWALRDAQMSRLLAPFSDALVDHANMQGAKAALDIGCGSGSQTLAVARHLGPDARVLGVDISAPLLEVAEGRLRSDEHAAEHVRFLRADASSHHFGLNTCDLLFSRFGVMFFDDPAVAFTHLRGASTVGGRLVFCCWQALADNDFVALPLEAAMSVLPPLPRPEPNAPGPFAFADADYLEGLLAKAGWTSIGIEAQRVPMRWAGEGLSNTVQEMVNAGPIGGLLAETSDVDRAAIYATSEKLLAPFYHDHALQLESAVWMVTAQNGN